jgi:hypothetical protein
MWSDVSAHAPFAARAKLSAPNLMEESIRVVIHHSPSTYHGKFLSYAVLDARVGAAGEKPRQVHFSETGDVVVLEHEITSPVPSTVR